MRSLLFLMRKTAKNKILQLRRKPALLVAYLIFAAFIVFSLFSASGGSDVGFGDGKADIGWLKLAFLGYTCLFAFSGVYAGLSSGSSVFEMCDVNFLFVSPLNSKGILIYGLGQQAVKSIFASVFVLMMGSTLNGIWGVTIGGMLALFAGYVLALVLFQFISVVIYMYANSRPGVKKGVAVVCALFLLPLALTVLLPYLSGVPIADALMGAMRGHILLSIPVAGWLTEAVFGLLSGNWAMAALGLGLSLGAGALGAVLLTAGRSDYYEDVLVATETSFQRKQAAAEGNLQAMTATARAPKHRRANERPLWGQGASVFLGKHMREDFRRNRLKILDASSFTYILTAVVMAFFMKDSGGLLTILMTTMLMRTLLVGNGLGLKELYTHYIYMIPASSFSKIVWSNLELAIKCFAESVAAYVIAGWILKAPIADVAMSVVVTSAFTLLLVAINLLSMRIFANVLSQGLLVTFYMLFVLLVMAPGVVAGVVCFYLAPAGFGFALALLAITVWELLLSALFFFLARGVLHRCDMEVMPRSTR